MRIYEYGKENPECILLIHPSLVTWDYFEYVIPLLEKRFHMLIPALPGYDLNDDSEFSSVEQIASEVGFSDTKSFCRVFKKQIGQTAGSYRKNLKMNGAMI